MFCLAKFLFNIIKIMFFTPLEMADEWEENTVSINLPVYSICNCIKKELLQGYVMFMM